MDKRALLAMASILGSGLGAESFNEFRPKRIRTSNRYPEQSSRQAMRAHRRAQGGPGIVLVGARYQARA